MMKASILLILVVLLVAGLQSLERRSLYFPDRILFAKPAVYRLPFEEARFTATDGTHIHGWYIPGSSPFTVFLCHGNAGNISHRLDKAMRLHKLGLGVFLFDYRGYGLSDNRRPSERGTYQDAEAAYRYLTETLRVSQVIFYGESLGCAVALETALHHSGAGLILESPFTSTTAMAQHIFPWLPARWIVRNRYDNLSKIRALHMPVLILHSRQDEVIPFDMGRELFAAAPGPKAFIELISGHNDGYLESGTTYTEGIRKFVQSLQ